jgi:PIN domain nuclease of toxin-antitoxin system
VEGDEMIVLDTCAIIWNALSPELLSNKALKAIEEAETSKGIIFCEVSFWEIAMLIKKGKLQPGVNFGVFISDVLKSQNYIVHGMSPEIAELSVNLPPEINNDPSDRIIAATSIVLKAPLVTADKNLRKSKVLKTIW